MLEPKYTQPEYSPQQTFIRKENVIGLGGTTVYGGSVVSSAAVNFPTGWSINHSGTGVYVITHNLGTTEYNVIAGPRNVGFALPQTRTTTAITIYCYNTTPSSTDLDFDFTVIINE